MVLCSTQADTDRAILTRPRITRKLYLDRAPCMEHAKQASMPMLILVELAAMVMTTLLFSSLDTLIRPM